MRGAGVVIGPWGFAGGGTRGDVRRGDCESGACEGRRGGHVGTKEGGVRGEGCESAG